MNYIYFYEYHNEILAKSLGIKERTLADILINKQKMIPNSQQNINFR